MAGHAVAAHPKPEALSQLLLAHPYRLSLVDDTAKPSRSPAPGLTLSGVVGSGVNAARNPATQRSVKPSVNRQSGCRGGERDLGWLLADSAVSASAGPAETATATAGVPAAPADAATAAEVSAATAEVSAATAEAATAGVSAAATVSSDSAGCATVRCTTRTALCAPWWSIGSTGSTRMVTGSTGMVTGPTGSTGATGVVTGAAGMVTWSTGMITGATGMITGATGVVRVVMSRRVVRNVDGVIKPPVRTVPAINRHRAPPRIPEVSGTPMWGRVRLCGSSGGQIK